MHTVHIFSIASASISDFYVVRPLAQIILHTLKKPK